MAWTGNRTETADALLASADAAMYESKRDTARRPVLATAGCPGDPAGSR